MSRLPGWFWISTSGAVLGATLVVVFPVLQADFRTVPDAPPPAFSRGTVAVRVEDAVLYHEDMVLLEIDSSMAHQWRRDELLARTASDEGLEVSSVSRVLQHRARQIYLRDLLLERIAAALDRPTEQEALAHMSLYPEEFFRERHYFHILMADSVTADSIHRRLLQGESFPLTAQRASLSQKAALGGDLGYLTGGEMFLSGMPREMALLEGLSPVFHAGDGWHVLLVTETRPLTDTARVVPRVQDYLFHLRFEAAVESVLSTAALRYQWEVNL